MADKPYTATDVNRDWRDAWESKRVEYASHPANPLVAEVMAKALKPFLNDARGGIHDLMRAFSKETPIT